MGQFERINDYDGITKQFFPNNNIISNLMNKVNVTKVGKHTIK